MGKDKGESQTRFGKHVAAATAVVVVPVVVGAGRLLAFCPRCA